MTDLYDEITKAEEDIQEARKMYRKAKKKYDEIAFEIVMIIKQEMTHDEIEELCKLANSAREALIEKGKALRRKKDSSRHFERCILSS